MSDLLKINVNDHVEKKQNLTYLSWAWAWAEVLKIDPQATWEAAEFDGFPASFAPDGSALVKVQVTIKGHAKTCWLPVMNHSNKAIKNPDAFAINTAIVRCLTKCISMHGLGLYIYAGEDLPEEEQDAKDAAKPAKKDAGGSITPTGGALDAIPEDERAYLQEMAAEFKAVSHFPSIVDRLEAEQLDNEQKVALWSLLPSHIRSGIKKEQEARKQPA
jgi:hypothetical protein